jgi:hypothetical protein
MSEELKPCPNPDCKGTPEVIRPDPKSETQFEPFVVCSCGVSWVALSVWNALPRHAPTAPEGIEPFVYVEILHNDLPRFIHGCGAFERNEMSRAARYRFDSIIEPDALIPEPGKERTE